MQRILYIAVFISGMTTLAVEMLASRLLGNVFGTSNLVWASIIGLILIYLTAGYFIGGRWADRSPNFSTFFKILIWAAISIAIVPVISRPILRLAADAFDELQLGVLFGSFVAVLILLIIPITLLGTASPFAIRLAIQDTQAAGRVSGKIYAISTLGSFVGTFIAVLLLIPTIGTYESFVIFGGILILAGILGLGITCGWRKTLPYLVALLFILILAFWGITGSTKTSKGQVYETESAYNYIQVLEEGGYYYLRLNEGQGIHSIYHPTQLWYGGPWEQVLAAPFFNPAPYDPNKVTSMAIVGLAAGTTARQATAVYGNIRIDGIEIDPVIVDIGRKYFGMNMPNLNVIIQDGRWGLAHSNRKYQIISVDAYRPPYIPFHLTTIEFFELVREHLTDDGVLVMNIGRAPNDRRLINALGSTIKTVFPSIYVVDIPDTFNSILYATAQPTRKENIHENFDILSKDNSINPLLIAAVQTAALYLQPAPEPAQVFTDDLAPVEWITNNMVLNFIFSGNTEDLQ